jgi:hypothetical protein
MCYLGIGTLFVSWWQVSCWAIFAGKISFKTRIAYFKACLDQDAEFYDINNPNEM